MILSNEPGYYKTGAYGIRIENLVLVDEAPGRGRRETAQRVRDAHARPDRSTADRAFELLTRTKSAGSTSITRACARR